MALDAPTSEQVRRLGFLTTPIKVPDDFDQMGAEAIEAMFAGALLYKAVYYYKLTLEAGIG